MSENVEVVIVKTEAYPVYAAYRWDRDVFMGRAATIPVDVLDRWYEVEKAYQDVQDELSNYYEQTKG